MHAISIYAPLLLSKLSRHVYLSLSSLGFAALIGLPLAIVLKHLKRMRQMVLAVINVLQTIPSLALLALESA